MARLFCLVLPCHKPLSIYCSLFAYSLMPQSSLAATFLPESMMHAAGADGVTLVSHHHAELSGSAGEAQILRPLAEVCRRLKRTQPTYLMSGSYLRLEYSPGRPWPRDFAVRPWIKLVCLVCIPAALIDALDFWYEPLNHIERRR